MVVLGQIEGVPVEWKIDTGARSTFITKETYNMLVDKPVLAPMDSSYVTANGDRLECFGRALMHITFGECVFEHEVNVGGVRNNLIGEDFITTYRCNWDHDEACFVIKGSRIPFEGPDRSSRASRVIALETVMVPSGHEAVIKSGLTARKSSHSVSSSVGVLTPERPFLERYGLALAKTLVDTANATVYARVYNPGPSDVTVYKHTHMAIFTPVQRIGPTLKLEDGPGDSIGVEGCTHLTESQKEEFKKFLITNQTCFARPGEVGRTNMGTHKIKLKDERPIREPPRRIPIYKRQALEEEVKKLEEKGLIEKSNSPWSSQTEEISFLGHIVSKKGVQTDPAKVKAESKECDSRFSKIAKPLFDLTKKDKKFHWNQDCEDSFLELKNKLMSAPILAFPQVGGNNFILDTDASAYAIGAVLSQVQDGKERVIAYGSRCLDKAERNYCVTRREMLAVVFFTKYFKHYLLGRKFLLRTDHGSLTWLQRFREPDGQIHRWIQQLSQFHLVIEHRPGNKHGNADAMSRLVTSDGEICKQCAMPWNYSYSGPVKSEIKEMKEGEVATLSDESENESERPERAGTPDRADVPDHSSPGQDENAPGGASPVRRGRKPNRPKQAKQKKKPSSELDNLEFIRQQQEEDDVLKEILKLKLDDREKPEREEICLVKNDVLCLLWQEDVGKPRLKICIPRSITDEVLWYLHDAKTAGHQGVAKTLEKAKISPFYWQGMRKSVKYYVSKCEICGERKNPAFKKRHPLKSHVVGAPFERIATDIAGPYPLTDKGNKYILVVADYFSKLTEIYAIQDIRAETVADTIFRGWIKRYGCPMQLHSDQGRQYESLLFQELCKLMEVKKTRTTPLHPRSDGMVERMNKTINDMLSKYIKPHQRDWDEYLDYLMMVYNSTPHQSTGFTPHHLVYGEEMRMPLDLLTEKLENNEENRLATEYAVTLEDNLRKAQRFARENLGVEAKRQKSIYDRNVKSKTYEVGDRVWRNQKKNIPGQKAKIARHWTGPWIIIEKMSDIIFRLKFSKNSNPVTVHGDNLKPYIGDKEFNWFDITPIDSGNADLAEFPSLEDYATLNESRSFDRGNDAEIILTPPSEAGNQPNENPKICPSTPEIHPESSARIRSSVSEAPDGLRRTIAQRFGKRTVKLPPHLADFVLELTKEVVKMPVLCPDCGKQFANKRNLNRHINSHHEENVRATVCPEIGCRRYFYRREYLQVHLCCTHKYSESEAKGFVSNATFDLIPREKLDPVRGVVKCEVAQERNVKTEREEIKVTIEANSAGPSSSKKVKHEVNEVIQDINNNGTSTGQKEMKVDIISLNLIKKTYWDHDKGELVTVREQRMATSSHIDMNNFNWEDFVINSADEVFAHLEEIRKVPSTVKVRVVDEDSDEDIESD
ncbi:unnamed protein product [Mytilus coruscus]|uniref:RNA-directed DNA polymerase n=1 Tax=Mytilus coruscus TaxID=42192 RepID=A0A6J8B5T3_MYTCO|nr:unnamed protein product [Mytilus coruscus]